MCIADVCMFVDHQTALQIVGRLLFAVYHSYCHQSASYTQLDFTNQLYTVVVIVR